MTLLTNLVSYWKFDESSGNAADAQGSNTLTNNNSITYVAGEINNAAHINSASTQYFSITDASQSGLDLTGDFSVSFWVKYATLPDDGIRALHFTKYLRAGNQRSYYYGLLNTAGAYSMDMILSSDGTATENPHVTWTPSTGTWYHQVIVFTAASAKSQFYVNGAQQGADQIGAITSLKDGTATFEIGQNDGDENPRTYVFNQDEMGIWSRPLSAGEVSQLYNSGAGLAYPFATPASWVFTAI